MGMFRRRQATAVKEAPVPAPEPSRGNGNGFTGVPPSAVATSAADEAPRRSDAESRIFLGVDVASGKDVYLSLSQLKRPTHIQAGTGEGKTLVQAYLAERFISTTDAAVVFADFSEDQAAAHYVIDAAKRAGRTSRLLSTVPEHASAWFDAFKPIYPLTEETVVQAKDYVMAALSLARQGKDRYWGKVNETTILRAFKSLAAKGVTHPDQEDVRKEVEGVSRGVRKQDAVEALLEMEQLATQRVLYRGDPAHEIDYDQVLEEKEVVYLLLGVLLNSAAPAVGALNVWGAVSAAIRRKRRGLPRRRLVLVIDEYAMVAHSSAYKVLVVLCRKFGITLIIANQSTQQLKESGNDQTVFDSTPTKIWLSPRGDDIETIRGLSEETWKPRKGHSFRGLSVSNQVSEFRDPKIERNDVLGAASTPMELYLIEFGEGHKEPRRVRFTPPWTVEDWEEMENRPLPTRDKASTSALTPPPKPAPINSKERKRRVAVLTRLLAKKKDLESFEVA